MCEEVLGVALSNFLILLLRGININVPVPIELHSRKMEATTDRPLMYREQMKQAVFEYVQLVDIVL